MINRNLTVKTAVNPALEFASLTQEELISLPRNQRELSFVGLDRSEQKVSSLWKGHYYVSSR